MEDWKAYLSLLQQLAPAFQGRFIWLIRLPPILCLQGHAGFEQFTLRAKAHSWNSHTGDTSANYNPPTSNEKQPEHMLHGSIVPMRTRGDEPPSATQKLTGYLLSLSSSGLFAETLTADSLCLNSKQL